MENSNHVGLLDSYNPQLHPAYSDHCYSYPQQYTDHLSCPPYQDGASIPMMMPYVNKWESSKIFSSNEMGFPYDDGTVQDVVEGGQSNNVSPGSKVLQNPCVDMQQHAMPCLQQHVPLQQFHAPHVSMQESNVAPQQIDRTELNQQISAQQQDAFSQQQRMSLQQHHIHTQQQRMSLQQHDIHTQQPYRPVQQSDMLAQGLCTAIQQTHLSTEEMRFLELLRIVPTTIKANLIPCPCCGDKSTGYHYGFVSCEACKAFFGRSMRKGAIYECKNNKDGDEDRVYCVITKETRNSCQKCRFNKCKSFFSFNNPIFGRNTKKKTNDIDQACWMEFQKLNTEEKNRILVELNKKAIKAMNKALKLN